MTIPVDWAIPQFVGFILVVARLSGLFLLAPVFSSQMIPVRVKIMALLALAVTMMPVMDINVANMPTDGVGLTVMVLKESLIGLALGFAVAIVFAAVQVGAMLIDTSIGFALANIIDPLNNTQATIFGSFYTMVATLAFLAIDGHHWMLMGFVRSFDAVPIDQMPNFGVMLSNAHYIFGQIFVMAFQIAAPVLVTLLLADVVLGIVARVVPQMNVFFVGIPLKIGLGMIAVIVSMPSFVSFFESRLSDIVTGASVLANAAP